VFAWAGNYPSAITELKFYIDRYKGALASNRTQVTRWEGVMQKVTTEIDRRRAEMELQRFRVFCNTLQRELEISYQQLSLYEMRVGNYDAALEAWNDIRDVQDATEREKPSIYWNRAIIFMRKRDWDAARRSFEDYIQRISHLEVKRAEAAREFIALCRRQRDLASGGGSDTPSLPRPVRPPDNKPKPFDPLMGDSPTPTPTPAPSPEAPDAPDAPQPE
jgi:tetratricopeptide (TPR) repeat protein